MRSLLELPYDPSIVLLDDHHSNEEMGVGGRGGNSLGKWSWGVTWCPFGTKEQRSRYSFGASADLPACFAIRGPVEPILLLCSASSIRPSLRPLATAVGLFSMLSFVEIVWIDGPANAQLTRYAAIDVSAALALVAGYALDRRSNARTVSEA